MVAAKTAGIGFRRLVELSDLNAVSGEDDRRPAASKVIPPYLTPADAERIDRIWNIREEGSRLLRLGMKRRREILEITRPTERTEADREYRVAHRESLANINTSLLRVGETNFYFSDSQEPQYEGYCAFQRWRIPDTPENRSLVERFLPKSLPSSERWFRCYVINRHYTIQIQ
jgi:hypothetical protein